MSNDTTEEPFPDLLSAPFTNNAPKSKPPLESPTDGEELSRQQVGSFSDPIIIGDIDSKSSDRENVGSSKDGIFVDRNESVDGEAAMKPSDASEAPKPEDGSSDHIEENPSESSVDDPEEVSVEPNESESCSEATEVFKQEGSESSDAGEATAAVKPEESKEETPAIEPDESKEETPAITLEESKEESGQGERLLDLAATSEEQRHIASHISQEFCYATERRRGPGARLAETFMERMRSRADPDALCPPPTPPQPADQAQQMIYMDAHDAGFIVNTECARKRVHVVQLLIIGLVGLLLGWLGNFYVATSCHFVSLKVAAGQNGAEFDLHYGLWKYSPADSAMSGYTYCYPYSAAEDGSSTAPIIPRIANLVALLSGTYSLSILWYYLISGRMNLTSWRAATYTAMFAGAAQLATQLFFATNICRQGTCVLGPAGIVACLTSFAWIIFGLEIYYNTPGPGRELTMPHLEMHDLEGASKEYMDRLTSSSESCYVPPNPIV
jgi:hypothetical protein